MTGEMQSSVDLYWLPLGAGGRSVRLNGRIFEAVVARLEKRPTKDLYHSALAVRVPEGEFVIEQAPMSDGNGALRGVVAEGAVGSRWARSLRIFRYEIRRWRDGVIPDVDEAVDSPQRLTDDPFVAQRVLELVPDVPTPVWGRDELRAGEMWNSNSVISWLIARSGLGVESVHPPAGGRAPGWRAGVVVARRQEPFSKGAPYFPATGAVVSAEATASRLPHPEVMAHARNILVGYDGSEAAERALDAAAGLAGYGSALAVVTVARNGSSAASVLDGARERLLGKLVRARYLEPVGDPAEKLIETARELDADLVVVGRRDQSALQRLVLGSVSAKVVSGAPCDVLVVR